MRRRRRWWRRKRKKKKKKKNNEEYRMPWSMDRMLSADFRIKRRYRKRMALKNRTEKNCSLEELWRYNWRSNWMPLYVRLLDDSGLGNASQYGGQERNTGEKTWPPMESNAYLPTSPLHVYCLEFNNIANTPTQKKLERFTLMILAVLHEKNVSGKAGETGELCQPCNPSLT